jgi:single-strand DNA-binding protein
MYNNSTIIGRLGNDPEVRFMQNQTPVATLSVATTESWKDKTSGERKERTEWHRVVVFGKLAEIAGEYLKKGALALFEGPIRNRKWKGQDGQERYTTELHASGMKMLPSGSSKNGAASPSNTTENTSSASSAAMPPAANYPEMDDYIDGEDIPF